MFYFFSFSHFALLFLFYNISDDGDGFNLDKGAARESGNLVGSPKNEIKTDDIYFRKFHW